MNDNNDDDDDKSECRLALKNTFHVLYWSFVYNYTHDEI